MATLGRSRLSMLELIKDGILEPGEKVLTFDYMVSPCYNFIRVFMVYLLISMIHCTKGYVYPMGLFVLLTHLCLLV